MDIDWLDKRDLEISAMRDRYGYWRSLFKETDEDIKRAAEVAVNRILADMLGYWDYATRVEWMKRWKR